MDSHSPIRRGLRRRVVLAGTMLLSLLSLGVSAPHPVAAADPMVGAPEVGRCYQISQSEADAVSTAAATVDCSLKHRLQIYAVLRVPSRIDLDSDEIYTFTAERCARPAIDLLGDGGAALAVSAYQTGWTFVPTPEQQEQGAHWVSCMVGVSGGLRVERQPDDPGNDPGGLGADGVTAPVPSLEVTRGRVGTVTGRLPRNRQLCLENRGASTASTHCARTHTHERAGRAVVMRGAREVRDRRAEDYCDRRLPRVRDRIWSWRSVLGDDRRFVVMCFVPR